MIFQKILIRLSKLIFPIILKLDRILNSIYYKNPFGNKPIGSEKDYLELAEKIKKQNYPELDKYEKKKILLLM